MGGNAGLNGTVNANGCSTTVTFEYNAGIGVIGLANAIPSTVTGNSDTDVKGSITGLPPGVSVLFRVKAVSSAGTVYGKWVGFITGIK